MFWQMVSNTRLEISPSASPSLDEEYMESPSDVLASGNDISSRLSVSQGQLNALMDKIRGSGIATSLNISLPRIAVIGNQSAGKSSLIEGMSSINLPRSDGTCTRVPTDVQMTRKDVPWSCRVVLRFEIDDRDGSQLEQVRNIDFDATDDPQEVAIILRRAQLAILNPSVSPAKFVTLDVDSMAGNEAPLGSTEQYQFSINTVCVYIEGPAVADLSLTDLPGIIQSGDAKEVSLIKQMATRVIQDESCIILLAITMRDDIDNQEAVSLARKVDPEGNRTIGILTKPDTLQALEDGKWMPLFLNNSAKHNLKHGYFVARQPNLEELNNGISHKDARAKELDFFKSTEPWASHSRNSNTAKRIGTQNLVTALSHLLSNTVDERLPTLFAEIKEHSKRIQTEKTELPPAPSADPQRELLSLLISLNTDIDKLVVGSQGSGQLIQSLNFEYDAFIRSIRHTIFRIIPFAREDARHDASGSEPECLRDGSDGTDRHEQTFDARPTLDLSQVREAILKSKTRELPFNVPIPAKNALIAQVTSKWPAIMRESLQRMVPIVREVVVVQVQAHFGRFRENNLSANVETVIHDLIDRLVSDTAAQISYLAQMELHPWTANIHYFSTSFDGIQADLKQKRRDTSESEDECKKVSKTAAEEREKQVLTVLAELARLGYSSKEEDLAKLLPGDDWLQELEVAAEVRAYLQVAYKRIIDNFPRSVDVSLTCALGKKLFPSLQDGLRFSSPEFAQLAQYWLAEDANVSQRRADLIASENRVDQAMKALRDYQGSIRMKRV